MNKKKNHLVSNILFSFASIWRMDRFVVLLYGFNVFLSKATPFLLLFLPQMIIDELSNVHPNFAKTVSIICIMLLLIALANFLQRFTYSQTSVRLIRYRLEKCKELDLKTTRIAYQYMEDPEMLNRYNLARTACSNYNTGMEGLLRIVFDLRREFDN